MPPVSGVHGVGKLILRLGLGLKHYICEGGVDVQNELLGTQHEGLVYRSEESGREAYRAGRPDSGSATHVLKYRVRGAARGLAKHGGAHGSQSC